MTAVTQKEFTEKDKIQILLHEYDTLRQEILTRTRTGHQILAVAAVLFIWIITQIMTGNPSFWFWTILVGFLAASVAAVSVAAWFTMRDIGKAAKRIRELESDINSRAGEDLLIWETRWGGAVTGFWGRARPLPPTTTGPTD
jgi:hypothetical protein